MTPKYNEMAKPVLILLLLSTLATIVGCAGGSYRLYEGKPLQASEIAILTGQYPVTLCEVDGKPGDTRVIGPLSKCNQIFNSSFDGTFRIELLPGHHKLVVGYAERGSEKLTYSPEPVILEFQAIAGRTYSIIPDFSTFTHQWGAKVVEGE